MDSEARKKGKWWPAQVTGGTEPALHRKLEHEPASQGGGLAAASYTRGTQAWTVSSRVLGWRYTLTGGVRRGVRPYSVDGAGQVPEARHGWDWTYNTKGEVISAARKRTDGRPEVLTGEVWDYEFDASGNRVRQSRGRSLDMSTGLTMTPYEFNPIKFLSTSLTTDTTNALTSLSRAPGREVKGSAPESHAVTIRVNEGAEQPVDRQDWRRLLADPGGFQVPIPSGTQAEWRRVELKAQGAPGTPPDIRSGWVFSPPPQETLVHDLDGNLVEDARWIYSWDAENRLVGMQEKVIPVAAGLDPTTAPKRLKLEFAYDAQHRRIAKVVKEWQGEAGSGGFELVKDRRYVYDGWNMIAELDHTTATGTGLAGASVVRTQVWGQDLSGTMQGAGGVGGLLAVRHGGQSFVPLMDGNGNVMGLQGLGGAKDGQTAARYDYDAFGNRITNTAPELGEDVNPFGFSTKFTDEETGLVYYGYRYYAPELGRWPSRDPIGERGGINLYGMVGNDAVNRVDYLGLDWPTMNGSPMGHLAPYLWPGLADPPKMFPDSVWEAVEKSDEFQDYLKKLERIAKNKAELLKVKTERGYGDKFHIHVQDSPGMNPLQLLHAGVIAGGVDVTISAHDITIDCDLVSNLKRKCYCNAKADLPVALFDNYGFGGYTGNSSGNWGNTALKWLLAVPSLGQAKDYQISDFRKIPWKYEFSPEGL